MSVGIQKKIDNLGRITLPKEYRDFYHMEPETTVCVKGTPEGLLITHPKYKVVEIETKEA